MEADTINVDRLTAIVSRYLSIAEIKYGDSKKQYAVRYRGQLLDQDSAAAYERLSSDLRGLSYTPLFRKEKGQHAVILLNGTYDPQPSRSWVNVLLFALTVISVLFAGTYYTLGGSYNGPANPQWADLYPYILDSLGGGLAFTASLLGILVAHEFGHYLAGRYHRTHVTLPYFIPFPFSLFGTMGAFIQLKEPPRNKRILLDIGIAGPIAGLVVAIPVLLIGLSLSEVAALPNRLLPGQGLQLEGNSLLYLLAKYAVFGQVLPTPSSYGGLTQFQYWVRYFFTGQPLPLGGVDVLLHPVAWAGWAGLLVTALNLIPAGQLDGGHVFYVLFGKQASRILPLILAGLILLGFYWPGWWLWALLIFLLGRLHADPLDQITSLDFPRKLVALSGIVIFVLVFTPVPLLMIGV